MRLSDHDLLQLTEEDLLELPEDVLRRLSVKLLYDLKEARERLRQTSRNSSRPPSSDLPWDKTGSNDEDQRIHNKGKMNLLAWMITPWTPKKPRKPVLRKKYRTRRTRYSKPRRGKMKQALGQTTPGTWLRARTKVSGNGGRASLSSRLHIVTLY
jgi:hypothetical protein